MPMRDVPTAILFTEAYSVLLEETPAPPTFDELDARGTSTTAGPARVRRGWAVAVVAALLTVLAVVRRTRSRPRRRTKWG